jgi:hypothetical protein
MRQTFTLLLALLISMGAFAQQNLEVVQEKGHWGAKHQGEWIIKPKYDSLLFADASILTAYRKNKIFYFNTAGESIHKGRVYGSGKFMEGMGIVQDKKERYAILDKAGNMLSEPSLLEEPPVRYGKFVYLKQQIPIKHGAFKQNQCLYLETGLVKAHLTSVHTYQNFLVASELIPGSTASTESTLFDPGSGALMESEVVDIKDTLGHLFLRKLDRHTTLYEKSTQQLIKGFDEIVLLDSIYFVSKRDRDQSLYLWNDHQLLIRTECRRFEFRPKVIYAVLKEGANEDPSVRIFDYAGNLLRNEVTILHKYADGRIIFQQDSMQFIGNERGDAFSASYGHIAAFAVNGYRVVSDASKYSYINDRTYQKVPVDFPILYREVQTSSPRTGNILKKLITAMIVLPVVATVGVALALPTGGKSMEMVKGVAKSLNDGPISTGRHYEVLIPGPEQVFMEGYAVFCHYELDEHAANNVVSDPNTLTYNYVDTAGTMLNAKQYGGCYPFQGGKAWVKEGGHWTQINKKGTSAGKDKFEQVHRDENGFFKCWDSYTVTRLIFFHTTYQEYVLYDQNNQRLHKGVFSGIEQEGNVYYGLRGGNRIKLAEVPHAKAD